jgi:ankyrin repeat protein
LIHEKDNSGMTAFMHATRNGHSEIARELKKAGGGE